MNTKVVLLMCFVTLASASPVAQIGYPAYASPYGLGAAGHLLHGPALVHAAPAAIHTPIIQKHIIAAEPIDPNPQYNFSYGVSDPHTGDNKHAEETLVNGVVHGSYSLTEPDGTIRKVTYTADKINGFNAVVEKSGISHHVPAVAKVAVAPAIAHGHAIGLAPTIAHAPALISPAYHGIGLPFH